MRMQLPEAHFVPFLRWAVAGSLPGWQKSGVLGQCTQGLFRPHPPYSRNTACLEFVSSSSDHQQSTSAQAAGGSQHPTCSYGKKWAMGENRMRCFPEQTRIAAELGYPKRVTLSRMQLPEASFVPFLRWALDGLLPSWRKVGWWGQCTQGLFRPHPPSP